MQILQLKFQNLSKMKNEKKSKQKVYISEGEQKGNTKPPASGPKPPVKPAPQKPSQNQNDGNKKGS